MNATLVNRHHPEICVQVREALRRSREESRDLRGSLFRAEDVIKQLTLTKAGRRRLSSNTAQHHDMSRPSSSSALLASSSPAAAADEKERSLVYSMLGPSCGSGGGSNERTGPAGGTGYSSARPSSSSSSSRVSSMFCAAATAEPDTHTVDTQQSRGDLLSRVQQLERELRLADFRNARSMAPAVREGHGQARRTSLDDVRPKFVELICTIC